MNRHIRSTIEVACSAVAAVLVEEMTMNGPQMSGPGPLENIALAAVDEDPQRAQVFAILALAAAVDRLAAAYENAHS